MKPRLKVRMYRGEEKFYIRIESDHPAIPPFMPMRIFPSNFKDAKRESEKFLHLIRGAFRQVFGKRPGFARVLERIGIGDTRICALFVDLQLLRTKLMLGRSRSRRTLPGRKKTSPVTHHAHHKYIKRYCIVNAQHVDAKQLMLSSPRTRDAESLNPVRGRIDREGLSNSPPTRSE